MATFPIEEPQWNSAPAWKLPGWAEPIMVASILVGSMIITRRHNFRIFDRRRQYNLLDDDPDFESTRSSDDMLSRDRMVGNEGDDSSIDSMSTMKNPPKRRRCCGMNPDLAEVPVLDRDVLLDYYLRLLSMYEPSLECGVSKTAIWDVAQDHGLAVLEFEQFSWLSFLWPVHERDVQQWFMHGHQTFLTVLNRSYALIHIPGTVGFIAWYYYAAPSFNTFAVVRRTMTLTNLFAFIIFIFYPCMPPRLLPPEYGFLDSVGRNNAQSVWMSGKYVNALAAMPSMHFGYAFIIGSTFIYHSGVFRRTLETGETRRSKPWALFYVLLAIWYPAWILTTIVATANHYYLDAMMAFFVVLVAYLCNRVFLGFLPLEDLLHWCLRLNKPVPTTGDKMRRKSAS
ncbi:hypothetical protein LSUB1_G003721 [Lachnellula subtilissima]|uniref:Inositolphosphotransferase Aur1/Ipt1 domain-containing protein n=1 Tax=Lachnellula subtilissima TaxID=602034 RepID=A0A8H8RLR8_9HELO|nr:hypothetical protein LSUB1_G003721 [Lachnellula subtilissima]